MKKRKRETTRPAWDSAFAPTPTADSPSPNLDPENGRLLILDFSKPVLPLLSKVYDAYSFTALPALGKLVANDADSYRYLAESIRKHPDQETLKSMMDRAGYERTEYFNMTGGIVALHKGFKF